MANNNSMKNQLATKSKGAAPAAASKQNLPGGTLQDFLVEMGPEIQQALPKHLDVDRLTQIAVTAVRTTPKLGQCDQISFLAALMQAAQLGVEPNTGLGQAYLIPYGNQVQFQLSYKGLIDLALRSGQYKVIYAHEVYANDEFSFAYGLHKDLVHIPASVPQGEPVGYYAVYHLKEGGFDFVYWSRDRIIHHAKKFSMAVQKGWSSPWKTNFDAMAKKTVLKEVLKYAPKSIEFQKVVAADSTIKNQIAPDMSSIIEVQPELIEEPPADFRQEEQATEQQEPPQIQAENVPAGKDNQKQNNAAKKPSVKDMNLDGEIITDDDLPFN